MNKPAGRFEIMVGLLRGLLLLVAGVLAIAFPATGLKVVAVVGGCLLIVDSVLGAVTSRNYGVEANWPSWLGTVRALLVFVAGVAVLFSPILVANLDPAVLLNCIGVGAAAIGLIELFILLRYRRDLPPTWITMAGAAIYLAFGAVLLLLPVEGVLAVMQIAGALLAIFGIVQIVRAWKASSTLLRAPV
jgi:uncharacterized membrane protein HdeD (DUF308 family)